jgi:hypothetical protein
LAHGIEDPQERNSEIALTAFAAALESAQDVVEVELSPEADADGNIDFSMHNILLFQCLHQAISDEFEIIGGAQVFRDVLEGH